MDGGVGSFVYGFSYENYHTDGFLRHNSMDSERAERQHRIYPSQ